MNPINTLCRWDATDLLYIITDEIHCRAARFPYYRSVAKRYYRRKKTNVSEYDFPIKPFELRYVNPNDIEYVSGLSRPKYPIKNKFDRIGVVQAGEWDKNLTRFEDFCDIYESIKRRFIENEDWKETPYVREAINQVKDGKVKWHGCESLREIEQRCEYLESIYQDMNNYGYRSQSDLNKRTSYPRELTEEILVDVSRDGKPLFVDGKHRLSMAKIIGMDKIPVTVMVRHKQWMERLDQRNTQHKLPDHWDINFLPNEDKQDEI